MKTNITNKLLSALIILVFIGWGSNAFSGDAYLEGERGFPAPHSFLAESIEPMATHAEGTLNSGKGYCVMGSFGSTPEHTDRYWAGERGIANYPVVFEEIDKSESSGIGSTHDSTLLCLRSGSDERIFKENFNYSLGDYGKIN